MRYIAGHTVISHELASREETIKKKNLSSNIGMCQSENPILTEIPKTYELRCLLQEVMSFYIFILALVMHFWFHVNSSSSSLRILLFPLFLDSNLCENACLNYV